MYTKVHCFVIIYGYPFIYVNPTKLYGNFVSSFIFVEQSYHISVCMMCMIFIITSGTEHYRTIKIIRLNESGNIVNHHLRHRNE